MDILNVDGKNYRHKGARYTRPLISSLLFERWQEVYSLADDGGQSFFFKDLLLRTRSMTFRALSKVPRVLETCKGDGCENLVNVDIALGLHSFGMKLETKKFRPILRPSSSVVPGAIVDTNRRSVDVLSSKI